MQDHPPIDPAVRAEVESIYALYAALTCAGDRDHGLGGQLLYAGELDHDGARLVRASNIAGAASLSIASQPETQRAAIHEGIVDFLVTTLDEALRILKNEVRKRNGVAVAVSAPASQVLAEMHERGVQPDLVRSGLAQPLALFLSLGAREIYPAALPPTHCLIVLAGPPAGFEARAIALLPEEDHAARRWVRLSARFLGPRARRLRSVFCVSSNAEKILSGS